MSTILLSIFAPAEIDTTLLAASNKRAQASTDMHRALQVIDRIEHANGYETSLPWNSPETLQEAHESAVVAAHILRDCTTEINALDEEFDRRGGWTRYYLVLNSNGHVHSSTHCITTFVSTQYAWLTEQSGMTAEALVELAGESACTQCFPWAPVNPYSFRRHSVLEAPERKAARLVREAEKAAREQTKIAKALTTDGSEFVVRYGEGRYDREHFKTESAASQWVVSAYANKKMYDYSINDGTRAAIAEIVAAMANKHDTSAEEIFAEIDRKVTAKIKRDSRY